MLIKIAKTHRCLLWVINPTIFTSNIIETFTDKAPTIDKSKWESIPIIYATFVIIVLINKIKTLLG